jgi:hypothetical protein
MSGRAVAIGSIILGVLAGGCASGKGEPRVAGDVVTSWLECEECTDGELRRVVSLGDTAVPTLTAALQNGPPAEIRAQLSKDLLATYGNLKGYGPVSMTEEEYVRKYTENAVVLYRVRAAVALGAIGGPEPRRALEGALGRGGRDEVQRAVGAALDEIRRR